jgi:hypothetical protein
MTDSLAIQLRCTLGWQHDKVLSLSTVADRGSLTAKDDLAYGTGLNQADILWHDRRTLATEASEALDLTNALVDALGQTLTFSAIKGLLIQNRATEAGHEILVGGGSQAWASWLGASGDVVRIGPAGVLLVWNPSAAGYAVSDGSADQLRIENPSDAEISYDILLLGAAV